MLLSVIMDRTFVSIFPVHLTTDLLCNWPEYLSTFLFNCQYVLLLLTVFFNRIVSLLTIHFNRIVITLLSEILSTNKREYDWSDVQFLLDHEHLLSNLFLMLFLHVQVIYVLNKHDQELEALNIVFKYSTSKN